MAIVASHRAQELAEQFDALVSEFESFTGGLSPAEWRMTAVNSPIWNLGEDERRAIASIACHVADCIHIHTTMLRDAADGKPLPVPGGTWTVEGVARWNAMMAERNAQVTQDRVRKLLLAKAAAALELIHGLTDEQLDRKLTDADREALGPFNPGLCTVGQIIQQMLLGHLEIHRSSFQATVGR